MWFLPSRGRPEKVANLIRVAKFQTPVCLRLDADDGTLPVYLDLIDRIDVADQAYVHVEIGESRPVPVLTQQWVDMYPDLKWYGLLGDDVIPHTPNWDLKLVDAAGMNKVSHCSDGLNDHSAFTHGVIGGNFLRAIDNEITVEGLNHFYIDTRIAFLASSTNRLVYLDDVCLEHCHFSNGKSNFDHTYIRARERNGTNVSERDGKIFRNWVDSPDCKLKLENLKTLDSNIS